MEFKHFGHIVAFRTGEDGAEKAKLIGFHSRNLQVAELTPTLWDSFSSDRPSEERDELDLWNREIDYEVRDADIPQAPRQLLVNVAQICNLKCSYCAAGGDGTFGEAMKHVDLESIYDQVRAVLHDIPDGGEFSLTYFGGEPLVAPENIRMLARFVKLQTAGRRIRVSHRIITNATLISTANAELLAELNCHVTVSLDGPPAINDRNRPTKSGHGSTALTLRGLDILKKMRSQLGGLAVSAVFGKHHSDVLGTYLFLREFDFDSYRFEFAVEEGDADASRAYTESLNRTAEFAFMSGGEGELRRLSFYDHAFRALDEKRRLYNYCGAGKSLLTIDGKGRVAACPWFLGKPEEELNNGAEIDHARIAPYSSRLTDLNGCESCWARHLCGGGCMYGNSVKSGSKHKKDREFCERTRSTLAKAIEYYAQARRESEQGERSETH